MSKQRSCGQTHGVDNESGKLYIKQFGLNQANTKQTFVSLQAYRKKLQNEWNLKQFELNCLNILER